MCVYMHSCFVENHPIQILEDGPLISEGFCHTMADLRPPVAGAHDYVPWPRARWTAASVGLRGHIEPLRVSQPHVWVTAAAAAAVPASRPGPRMEPLARGKLGPAVAGQLLQHHGAPLTPFLGPGLCGGLWRNAPHHSISW
jgi:hypothetical protein